jgi:hypothetical protein
MFVDNRSSHQPRLARGRVDDTLGIAAVVVETTLYFDGEAWRTLAVPRTAAEPPDTADQPLWEGTSVTASGTVFGPRVGPQIARVDLEVGAETRSLVVSGDRRWVRNAGRLVASPAARFDRKPLSWALAFGGAYNLPPGKCPVRGIPHPGGRVAHPLNPGGIGYYGSEAGAEGKPLPSIEWTDAQVSQWDDQPEPAGLSPCPELGALRLPKSGVSAEMAEDPEIVVGLSCRVRHAAHGRLIFDALKPGTTIALRGVGAGMAALELPGSPLSVQVRKGESTTAVPFGVRWVHLDADARTARVSFGHSFGYSAASPPSSVVVQGA